MIEGPVTNRRFSRRLVRQIMVYGGGAVVMVALTATGYWIYQGRARSQAEAAGEAAKTQAQQIAGKVAAPFSALRKQLVTLGSDAAVIAAFGAGDASALQGLAEQHAGEFHFALKLRLLFPGLAETDPTAQPPLTFTSLDMLRRAEDSTAPVSAEVHLFGSPGQHIAMVAPALDAAGQLRGLLHLSLDVSMFKEVLDALEIPGAKAELRQADGGKSVVLGSAGDGAGAGQPVIVSVPDTRWNIAYFPAADSSVVGAAGTGTANSWLIPALVLVMAGVAGAAFVLRRGARVEQAAGSPGGGVIYAGAVRAIMEGVHPGMEKLVPNLPGMGQKRSITPVSKGMGGDDITRMSSHGGPKVVVGDTTEPNPIVATVKPAARQKPKPSAASAATPAPVPKPRPASVVAAEAAAAAAAKPAPELSPGIFRAYDIRGIVGKTLTADVVTKIGQAIGAEADARSQPTLAVGRDGRLSSPELAEALIQGLRAAGRNVIDIGMVPTPVLYFATHELGLHSGVMVTGSHNAPEYNGLKIVLGDESLSGDAIQNLYQRVVKGDLGSGQGMIDSADVVAAYIRRISDDIPVALGGAFKIVIDCGNGVAGAVAPQLIRALGHDVIELYCDVDGRFPNHHPDPSQPENLQALVERVRAEQADLGLAFDGDGDRLGVVDASGRIIWPDQQLMILARDVLTRNPGATIIYDVKCSRHLGLAIEAAGGQPLMWRTGHSLIKQKLKETNAPLAGEMSGHIFFKERWFGFDDAMYTAARLLEVLMATRRKPVDVFAELPESVTTPELRVPLPEDAHAPFMQTLGAKLSAFTDARVIDIDGFRVEFSDGWGLVRPSNTSPALVVRFEADNDTAMQRIKEAFRGVLLAAQPGLKLPF
jgi:phosphomannomutase/phosphoglucomutase